MIDFKINLLREKLNIGFFNTLVKIFSFKKFYIAIFFTILNGCERCDKNQQYDEQEALNSDIDVIRKDILEKANIVYINRRNNRPDDAKMTNEEKERELEDLQKEMDQKRVSDPDAYDKCNKDIEQIFNELLYHTFNYPCSYELIRKSFVMSGIFSEKEAEEVFKVNKIDYKRLVELICPSIDILRDLTKVLKSLCNSSEYKEFSEFLRTSVGRENNLERSLVEVENLLISSDKGGEQFTYGENSINHDVQIVQNFLRDLVTYLTDVYVFSDLGVLNRKNLQVANLLSNNSIQQPGRV